MLLSMMATMQCLSTSQARGASVFPSLSELVPVQSVTADVMKVEFSKRSQELAARMQRALADKQQWFLEYMKTHANEGRLPYHESFGLTKEEYDEFLASSKSTSLQKTTQIPLTIVRTKDVVEIRFDETKNSLQPISIDLAKETAATPLATMESPKKRDSGPEGGALGPHRSYTWKSRTGSVESGTWTSVEVSIGTILASGKKFLRYHVQQFADSKPQVQFETLLFYELPTEKSKQSGSSKSGGR